MVPPGFELAVQFALIEAAVILLNDADIGALHSVAFEPAESTESGYTSKQSAYHDFIGEEAIASTILLPSGKIEINEESYDATAESGYIEKGEKVKIIRYENMQLIVRKTN